MNQQIRSNILQHLQNNKHYTINECSQDLPSIHVKQITKSFIQIYKNHFKQYNILCLLTIHKDGEIITRYCPYNEVSQGKLLTFDKERRIIHFNRHDIKELTLICLYDKSLSYEMCMQKIQNQVVMKDRVYENKYYVKGNPEYKINIQDPSEKVKDKQESEKLKESKKKIQENNNNMKASEKIVQKPIKASSKAISKELKKQTNKESKKQQVVTSYDLQQKKIKEIKEKKPVSKLKDQEFNKMFNDESQTESQSASIKDLFMKMQKKTSKIQKENSLQRIQEKSKVNDDSDQQDQALLKKMNEMTSKNKQLNKNTSNTQKNQAISQKPSAINSKKTPSIDMKSQETMLSSWLNPKK